MNTGPSRTTLNVFLVEDAEPIRRRIAQLLGDIADVRIVGEAEDEDTALTAIRRLAPDVAVIDLRLAAGTCLRLISMLKAEYPKLVIIVLTNHSARAFETACRAAGADFFFDKTTEFEAVHRTIAALASTGSR